MKDIFDVHSYDYVLPDDLIAQVPHDPVDQCRMMIIDRKNATISHTQFNHAILKNCSDSDVIFFNNSKVVRARIPLDDAIVTFSGKSFTIDNGELFYLGSAGYNSYKFMVRPGSKIKVGSIIKIKDYVLSVVDSWEYGRIIFFDGDVFSLLQDCGQMPLPPYIGYDNSKESLYQPVVALHPGSVASPTASLHFTEGLIEAMKIQGVTLDYVTLHVGIGTFRVIKTPNIKDYDIHSEQCEIDLGIFGRIYEYKKKGKNIIAVGTTACRTLESLPYVWIKLSKEDRNQLFSQFIIDFWDDLTQSLIENGYIPSCIVVGENIQFDCKLFIVPGFSFMIIDQLITNLHLPKSSLMVLIASLMGYDLMMRSYEEAIKKNYLFYSFGDAMWII